MKSIVKYFLQNRRLIILTITPFLLLPILFISSASNESHPLKFRCAYVILLMGSFWMTEAMPLAITALIPVILFPAFNIQSTGEVCQNYMKESVMMFVGGISLALAIEYCGFYKRVALRILIVVGTSPWRLLLGLMITTMFLSCWIIINTAVAAMMLPIVTGLVQSLDEDESGSGSNGERKRNLNKLFMLAVGYSANIGGTATMIGSNPNLIAKELLSVENIGQGGKYTDLNFSTWMVYNMPIAIINLLITWAYLGMLYLERPSWCKFPWRTRPIVTQPQSEEIEFQETSKALKMRNSNSAAATATATNIKKALHEKLSELGPMSFHEYSVLILFAIAILLWFTRDPQIFPGWASLFGKNHKKIGDASVAVAIVIFMFVIPKELKLVESGFGEPPGTLLNWPFIQSKFPWNVILLVGGGFAISDGANKSGLSKWVGTQLSGLESLPNAIILLIFLLAISFITEIISNAACANLLLPILIALSKKLNVHPLYFSLPGTIACQYAFMLPTANPPNAIVFTAGGMKILDMVKAGAILNCTCVLILFLMNIIWGQIVFNYDEYVYLD